MIRRSVLALSLTLLAACAAETAPSTSETSSGTQPGGATPGANATVYTVSCDGELSVKCIGGAQTDCVGTPTNCDAHDVKFFYEPPVFRCIGTDLYEWNGKDCVAHNTHGEGGMLRCQGSGCAALFKTKDACEAHRSKCLGK